MNARAPAAARRPPPPAPPPPQGFDRSILAKPELKLDGTIPLWGVVLLALAIGGQVVGYAVSDARMDQRATAFDQRLTTVERNQADIAKIGEAVARIDERTKFLDQRLSNQEARR